jgi:hypothetical protein
MAGDPTKSHFNRAAVPHGAQCIQQLVAREHPWALWCLSPADEWVQMHTTPSLYFALCPLSLMHVHLIARHYIYIDADGIHMHWMFVRVKLYRIVFCFDARNESCANVCQQCQIDVVFGLLFM